MKKVLLVTLLSSLIAAANYVSFKGGEMVEKERHNLKQYVELDSTCLVDAVAAHKFLKSKGIEARIIVFSLTKKEDGSSYSHAMLLYSYGEHVFLYDKEGSQLIPPTTDILNPLEVVKAVASDKFEVTTAKFL